MDAGRPTRGDGKICYLEIPTDDIDRSVAFYEGSFGWRIRQDNSGHAAFDDGVGEVSGMWVLGRPPSTVVGILISIMVDDIHAALERVVANGGTIVEPVGARPPEITARFTDPYGNIMALYQEPNR